jgi:methanogenic corrinoid protein MtbC1
MDTTFISVCVPSRSSEDRVGASVLGSPKPQCKAINDALIEAGIRDDVIYIIGGRGITREWCDSTGADAFGENAVDALDKVNALPSGDLPK